MRVMTRIALLFVLGAAVTAVAAPKRSHTQPAVRAHRISQLGIAAIDISPQLREHFGAPRDQGVLVDVVQADSTAAHAGVLVGDVVIEVGGEPIGSPRGIRDAMRGRDEGDDLAIAIIRDAKRLDLHAPVSAPGEVADDWLDFGFRDDDLERMMDRARELFRRRWQAQPEGERI
jgi:hypothetical protein